MYLPKLDEFVCAIIRELLHGQKSVSITNDGWSDIRRRQWLGFSIYFINRDWKLICLEPDLLPVYSRTTAEVLSNAISEEVAHWIPEHCLIATATTDGAANEVAAGTSSLVFRVCL